MKRIVMSLCAVLLAPAAGATARGGPAGWSASNLDGECSLQNSLEVIPGRVVFKFTAGPRSADGAAQIVLSVIPFRAAVQWPMQVHLGPTPTAPTILVSANSSAPPSLPAEESRQLFEHLKEGGEVHASYSMATDSGERQGVLDRLHFARAAAAFEACVATTGSLQDTRAIDSVCTPACDAPGASRWIREEEGWTASAGGSCMVRHTLGPHPNGVVFMFWSDPENTEQPSPNGFSAIPMYCELAAPVRIRLGSSPDARAFQVGAASGTRSLPSAEALQVFQFLKTGGEASIDYTLAGGVEQRRILGQKTFAQSAAMFEACAAAPAN